MNTKKTLSLALVLLMLFSAISVCALPASAGTLSDIKIPFKSTASETTTLKKHEYDLMYETAMFLGGLYYGKESIIFEINGLNKFAYKASELYPDSVITYTDEEYGYDYLMTFLTEEMLKNAISATYPYAPANFFELEIEGKYDTNENGMYVLLDAGGIGGFGVIVEPEVVGYTSDNGVFCFYLAKKEVIYLPEDVYPSPDASSGMLPDVYEYEGRTYKMFEGEYYCIGDLLPYGYEFVFELTEEGVILLYKEEDVAIPSEFDDVPPGDWRYIVSNGKATIIQYTGSDIYVTIPSELDMYPVTSLFNSGDYYDYGIFTDSPAISVTIPYSITSIGKYAFSGCCALSHVYYEGTLEEWNALVSGNDFINATIHCLDGDIDTDVTKVWVYNNGMENWTGSPNKDDMESATQILFRPDPWDGDYYQEGLRVTVRMKAVDGSSDDTFTARVATCYNADNWGICRLEPCLLANPWVPVKGVPYYATFTFIAPSGKKISTTAIADYDGMLAEYFLDAEPMVPHGSGTCGRNITWTLKDGVLTIFGTGNMDSYSVGSLINPPPWYSDAKSIKRVVINSGVTSIGNDAFYGCTKLTNVIIPDSVTSIGEGAFARCANLENIDVASGNPKYRVIENCFNDTVSHTLIRGFSDSVIPTDGSISKIGAYAFYGCSMQSIYIPDCVTEISYFALSDCKELISIHLPDSINAIVQGVFQGCSKLESVDIPNGVTMIIEDAFRNCTSLKSIHIPSSVSMIDFDYSNPFFGCSALESITVDSDNAYFRSAGNCLLTGATLLVGCQSSVIPTDGSVTYIGRFAFSGCTGLTSVTIPDGVTSIGDSAFDRCTALTSVTIPDSVTSIEWYAFDGCTGLTDVYYTGSKDMWQEISIGEGNDSLTNAVMHYNDVSSSFLYGDVSRDGTVNKKDSLALKKYLADNSVSIDLEAADVNGDGVVNKKDSLRLKQYLAGWEVKLGA